MDSTLMKKTLALIAAGAALRVGAVTWPAGKSTCRLDLDLGPAANPSVPGGR
jgi:hypothetical protein